MNIYDKSTISNVNHKTSTEGHTMIQTWLKLDYNVKSNIKWTTVHLKKNKQKQNSSQYVIHIKQKVV